MPFFRQQPKCEGFTLIEVMIALVILAVGILALGTMQIVSIRTNAFSSEMTYSTMLAQQRMEILRNLAYNDTDLNSGHHDELPTIIGDKGASYTVTWDVDTSVADMKTITVDITWQSLRLGDASEAADVKTTFQTIISEP